MSEFNLKALSYALTGLLFAFSAMVIAQGLFSSPTLLPGKGGTQSPASSGLSDAGAAKGADARRTDVDVILSRDLFNSARKDDSAPPAEDAALPASSVGFELIGTAVHSDPQWSMAFLVDKSNRTPKNVSVGGALGDAVVVSIEEDHMVLQRQGQQEILKKKP